MKQTIYIIGDTPEMITNHIEKRFAAAKNRLLKMNMDVHNPLEVLANDTISKSEKNHINYDSLVNANGVYILSNIKGSWDRKMEIRIAVQLNLLVMHEM